MVIMRAMRNGSVLAIDIGGSALRVARVRLDGTIEAAHTVPLAMRSPRAGWAEIDPALWWEAFLRAARRVLRESTTTRAPVQAICACALTRSQVLLDANGHALGPAILFRDRRASDVARTLPGVSAFDARARLAWVERHQPARFAKIATVVEPKDYLHFRLTGTLAADTVTRSRSEVLPFGTRHVVAPWASIGMVTPGLPGLAALAGVPVFAGALDTWAGAVGAGAVEPGQAYDIAGTSEAVGLVTATPVSAPGLLTLTWTATAHQVGGPTQAGADCARWCHDTYRVRGSLPAAIARVGAALRADAPLFLPYLAGERAPVWSSEVRAAFCDVDRAHGPDDFLWSALEGVAHAVRDILGLAQSSASERAHEVRVGGGGAQSDAWCALKADVLGLPLLRSDTAETGVIGAAMAAAVGCGAFDDLAQAARRMVRPGRRFRPHARHAAAYDRRAARYAALKQFALELSSLP